MTTRNAGLSPDVLAALRRQLEARRAALGGLVADETAALADPLGTSVPAPDASGDREAGASGVREVVTTLSQAHRAELETVEAALARIDDGDYGVCDACGGPVGLARLEVQPAAIRCIKCQDVAEHTRKPAAR